MPTVGPFPLPNRWSSRPVVLPTVAATLFGGVGTWWLIAAIVSAADGDILRFSFLFFAATTFFGFPGLVLVGRSSYRRTDATRARMVVGTGGVTVLPDRIQHIVQSGFMASFGIAALIFSIGMWTHTLDLPVTLRFPLLDPLIALIGAALVAIALGRVWFRGHTLGQLTLGPDGGSYESGGREDSWGWESVAGMTINSPQVGRRSSMGCVINLHLSTRRAQIAISTDTLSTGCAPTYWFVKYYVEHPEDRDELGDQRAIDRLMSGRVVTNRKNTL